MSDWAYHSEVLRKARALERKRAALASAEKYEAQPGDCAPREVDATYNDARSGQLRRFRVNEEGYKNRYRNRSELAPHTDEIYPTIYPTVDNSDYTSDANRNNRRQNLQMDKFKIREKVNGSFDIKVLNELMPCEHPVHVDFLHDKKKFELDREVSELRLQEVGRDQIYPVMHPKDSSCQVHRDLHYGVDYPVKHRNVDNSLVDKVAPLMNHPQPQPAPLPQCRNPHFKV